MDSYAYRKWCVFACLSHRLPAYIRRVQNTKMACISRVQNTKMAFTNLFVSSASSFKMVNETCSQRLCDVFMKKVRTRTRKYPDPAPAAATIGDDSAQLSNLYCSVDVLF